MLDFNSPAHAGGAVAHHISLLRTGHKSGAAGSARCVAGHVPDPEHGDRAC